MSDTPQVTGEHQLPPKPNGIVVRIVGIVIGLVVPIAGAVYGYGILSEKTTQLEKAIETKADQARFTDFKQTSDNNVAKLDSNIIKLDDKMERGFERMDDKMDRVLQAVNRRRNR